MDFFMPSAIELICKKKKKWKNNKKLLEVLQTRTNGKIILIASKKRTNNLNKKDQMFMFKDSLGGAHNK